MGSLTTVTDRKQINEIIKALFLKEPLVIQVGREDFPIQSIQLESDKLAIVTGELPKVRICKLKLQNPKRRLELSCTVTEQEPDGTMKLMPGSIMVEVSARKEKRVPVAPKSEPKKHILLNNCVSIKDFPTTLASDDPKRNSIINDFTSLLSDKFDYASIVLRNSGQTDFRLKAFLKDTTPIFVPDRYNPGPPPEFAVMDFEDYAEVARQMKLPGDVRSEISLPLVYRELYVYGYLSIMGRQGISAGTFGYVKETVEDICHKLEGQRCLPFSGDKCQVIDLSKQGLAFLHPRNPAMLNTLQPKEKIIFDLHFPGQPQTTILTIVKNMSELQNAYRVGVNFTKLSDVQKKLIIDYLKSCEPAPEPDDEDEE